MGEDVGEVGGEGVFGPGLQIGGGDFVVTQIAQAVAGESQRRTIHGGGKLLYAISLGGAQEPAFIRLVRPIVLARAGFKGFDRAPVIINGGVIDAGTEVEPPAGEANAGVRRKQDFGNALFVGLGPRPDFLQRPRVVRAEVIHGLMPDGRHEREDLRRGGRGIRGDGIICQRENTCAGER